MQQNRLRPALGPVLFLMLAFMLGSYFTFAAVQGNNGIFQRIETEAEIARLTETRDRLAAELGQIENRTRRLSDSYLDLDLLDERAREVLGMLRADEVVIR
ncbi:FtsB family cell division protein [Alkalilacustris brevis]|uniref:FtsB family cell division protein n=1 Tax=Alkalilacustris brevis TaxID=2026338 RepID=UPI000E0D1D7D|nr:septum formation initiator family protein [Alkalilacustris brevis]